MLTDKLKLALTHSFVDKYLGFSLRFISTIVIARLLSPHEVGIFSVAFVFISIGHVLRDFGVAQFLIREEHITKEKIRAALTLMWLIAWGLCGLLLLTKHLFSSFYNEPQLVHAIEILSLIFLLAPFGSVRIAMLRREMNFKALAKINIFSYVVVNGASMGLAFWGYGFMSLVWGQLLGVLATLLGTVYYCQHQYWVLPGFKELKAVLRFGLPVSCANMIEQASDGAPDLIMGKFLDFHSVGLYSRAMGCINIFKTFVTSAVWPVVLPYFSIAHRNGQDLSEDFLKGMQIYSAFAWPFFIGLAIFADPIVNLLYGAQWQASVPLVKIICIMAISEAVFPFRNAVLIAIGEQKLNFKIQLCISVLRIVAVCIGAQFSLLHCVIGLCFAEWLAFCYQAQQLKRVLKIRYMQMLSKLTPSIFTSVCMGAVLLYLDSMTTWGPLSLLSVGLILGLGVWLVALWVFKHPIVGIMSGSIQRFLPKP